MPRVETNTTTAYTSFHIARGAVDAAYDVVSPVVSRSLSRSSAGNVSVLGRHRLGSQRGSCLYPNTQCI